MARKVTISGFRIDPELADRFDSFLESQDGKMTQTEALAKFMDESLKREGF